MGYASDVYLESFGTQWNWFFFQLKTKNTKWLVDIYLKRSRTNWKSIFQIQNGKQSMNEFFTWTWLLWCLIFHIFSYFMHRNYFLCNISRMHNIFRKLQRKIGCWAAGVILHERQRSSNIDWKRIPIALLSALNRPLVTFSPNLRVEKIAANDQYVNIQHNTRNNSKECEK